MPTLAESLTASAERPLTLSCRPDLVAVRQRYEGRTGWAVKDPVALKYHRFLEEEYTLLRLIDGRRGLEDLKREFERRYAPQTVTVAELHGFVGRLHQSGLLVSHLGGQGPQLLKRDRRTRWQKFRAQLANPLAIRFRGIDPTWLLDRLSPMAGWLFSRWCVAAGLVLIVAAALLVLVQFDAFLRKLPSAGAFFSLSNLLLLSTILGATRVLHELGHGLVCRRMGARCHGVGLMLLILTPCLYCETSDSWMLRSKWRRMAIAAAGIYVELVLAASATFAWWFSQAGLFNSVAFNLMTVCSVSTLMFNGNPLLRFDGYYVLSDWLEIPNLQQKSTKLLQQTVARWCLGMPIESDAFMPRRRLWLFRLYAIAAFCYRWVVMAVILMTLNSFLEPQGLKVVGQTLAVVCVGTMVGMPLWKFMKFIRTPGRARQVKPRNVILAVGVLAAIIAFVAFVPFPQYTQAPLVVEAERGEPVYVPRIGRLAEVLVDYGDAVTEGQVIARLEDFEGELSLAELTADRDRQIARLEALKAQSRYDAAAADALPEAAQNLESIERRRQQLAADLKRLTLLAPRGGIVLRPERVDSQPPSDGTLARWSGTPLDAKNRGCHLEPGTVLCLIGDIERLEAVLVVDQSEVEFVRTGQPVEVQLEQSPFLLSGQVLEVAQQQLQRVPNALTVQAGGPLPVNGDPAAGGRPLSPGYAVRASLPVSDGLLRPGLRGRARVQVGSRTWGGWLVRTLADTFHFHL
jgi:putative peptide zinc metalloprotease protein